MKLQLSGPVSSYTDFKTGYSAIVAVEVSAQLIFYGPNPTSGNIDICQAIFLKNKVEEIILEYDAREGGPIPPTIAQFLIDFPTAKSVYVNTSTT
jgi:hypothetical protein